MQAARKAPGLAFSKLNTLGGPAWPPQPPPQKNLQGTKERQR